MSHYNRLRKYQQTGVNFMKPLRNGLLADDMGLGKTAQIIVAGEQNGDFPWVIVCPSTVKNQWAKEIARWTDEFIPVQVIRTGADKILPAMVYIVSYGLAGVIHENLKGNIGTLIVDEAHYCKNLDAIRTLEVLGENRLRGRAHTTWAMTGTPIYNRPVDLYSLISCMNPRALGGLSFEQFAHKFNSAWWPKYGGGIRLGRAKNIELLKPMLDGFMLRRLKKDVLDELPPVSVNLVEVDVSSQTKLKALNEKYAELKTRDSLSQMLKDPRGERAQLRRQYAMLKLDYSVEYIEHELEKYGKIAVFTYHREVAEELRTRLRKHKPVVFQGGMTDAQKEQAVTVFQDTTSRVFIGQVRASGTGLDGLQEVCQRGILVEWDEAPGAVTQLLGRLDRMGQTGDKVFFTFMVIPNSLESDMLNGLTAKSKDMKSILD